MLGWTRNCYAEGYSAGQLHKESSENPYTGSEGRFWEEGRRDAIADAESEMDLHEGFKDLDIVSKIFMLIALGLFIGAVVLGIMIS